jgi:hypothetical protein
MKAFPSLYVHFQKVDDLSDPRIIANTHTGMDLRDYFAAKAMQGLLANPDFGDGCPFEITEWAYEQADAMMKMREAK